MYSAKSFLLTSSEYGYLLPVLRPKLLNKSGKHYFISSTYEDLEDMLLRLKGLYDNFSESFNSMIVFECSQQCSLTPFRLCQPTQ